MHKLNHSSTALAVVPLFLCRVPTATLLVSVYKVEDGSTSKRMILAADDGCVSAAECGESSVTLPTRQARQPGSAKGTVWMAPDFDAPLEDFKDYM